MHAVTVSALTALVVEPSVVQQRIMIGMLRDEGLVLVHTAIRRVLEPLLAV